MRTQTPQPRLWGVFLLKYEFEQGGRVHLFPVAVPGIFVADKAASSSADCCHSLRLLYPPPAALPLLPIPNTEVKLMYACCGARHLRRRNRLPHLPTAATRSGRLICLRQRSHRSPTILGGRLPGKIGNANTKPASILDAGLFCFYLFDRDVFIMISAG